MAKSTVGYCIGGYLDCIVFKVRQSVLNKALFPRAGHQYRRSERAAGYVAGENEGASSGWVFNRGLQDILIACVDWLKAGSDKIACLDAIHLHHPYGAQQPEIRRGRITKPSPAG